MSRVKAAHQPQLRYFTLFAPRPRSQFFDWPSSFVSAALALLAATATASAANALEAAWDAQQADALIATATELELDAHPDWRRLLHIPQSARRSKVISPEFFLAEPGEWNPQRELNATLLAWFEPTGNEPDSHPRCRFPGRYAWLGRYLPLAETTVTPADCPQLDLWARIDELRSISVIMVSGYFGNPASSFGHLLMKLNHGEESRGSRLLDLGINYGAAVPENEWTVMYILRGLFGGYHAGFSDRTYYTQDHSYSRVEFRDMWEYELALDPAQAELLVLHLWESIGQRFHYYFLRENCALRLAELLELATGHDFGSGAILWYAPVSFFHRLEDVDEDVGGTLIRSVTFVPSSQRILYHEVDRLGPDARKLFNDIIVGELSLAAAVVAAADEETRVALLDVLLAYYQYRLAPFPADDDSDEWRALDARKNEILRTRLALPPSHATEAAEIEPLRAPAKGSKPSKGALSFAVNSGFGGYVQASFSAFHYDEIGNNNLAGSALVVLDATLGYGDSGRLFIDRVDFVRARKINLNVVRIAGESTWSWDVGTGIKRDQLDCTSCQELYAAASLGRAAPLGSNWIAHAMLGASLETRGDHVVLEPELGLRHSPSDRIASRLVMKWEQGLQGGGARNHLVFESRWSLSTNREIRLFARRQHSHELALGFFQYW